MLRKQQMQSWDKDVMTVYLAFLAVMGVVAEAIEFNVGLSTLPTLSVAMQILAPEELSDPPNLESS